MFKIAVVIFRESLEIFLLLSIIFIATKPVKHSHFFITLGSLIGVLLSSLVAFFVRNLTEMIDGIGDEIFNSIVILITAFVISWTVVWMQGYTKRIKKDLGELSDKINSGSASKIMLTLVVATTILREGTEILLFIYSISSADNITFDHYALGLVIGAFGGFLAGFILYKGLISYAGKYIFKISTILLILISAGLASEAAGIMTSVGIIEIFNDQLWDTSWLIDNSTLTGKFVNIITGYDAKPNGMQLIFYFGTILLTLSMMKIKNQLAKYNKING